MSRASIIVLLVAGCGVEIGEPPDVGTGSGKDDGSAMPLTATGFITRIIEQFCDEHFRCKATYPPGSRAFKEDYGDTVDECYADELAIAAPQLIEQSISAGRVVFNPSSAQLCMMGVGYQQSCSSFWQNRQPQQVPPSCNTALLGRVPTGGTCVTSVDCANANDVCSPATKKCVVQ